MAIAPHAAVPGGTLGRGASSRPLLEREAELARIGELIRSAAVGGGAVVAIRGVPGIGKTALLAAARATALDHGLGVLAARGGELERDFPYGVVRQLFEPLVASLPPAARAEVFEGAAALAAPVVDPGAPPGPARPSDGTFPMVHGLYWMTANLAQRQPLLVCVDDLHWADTASLRFLSYLARRIEALGVLVLFAARPYRPESTESAITSALEDLALVHLDPKPLTERAVATVVRDAFGAQAEEAFCRACHAAVGGNPFLLGLLVDGLRREGVPGIDVEAGRVADVAARSTSAAVVRRVAEHPAEAAVAAAVAILGHDAHLRAVGALAGLDDEVAAVTDRLVDQGVLLPGHPLELVHPLVRAAVLEQLPPGRRAGLHARAARLIDTGGAPVERVASHLLAAEPSTSRWAVRRLRTAAVSATSRGALEVAAAYLRRALAEPPEAAERGRVLAELGRAELGLARADEAARHLSEALELARAARERARLAHDLSVALVARGRYREAVGMLDGVIQGLDRSERESCLALTAQLLIAGRLDRETYPDVVKRFSDLDHDVAGATPGERILLAAVGHQGLMTGRSAAEAVGYARRALAGGIIREETADSGAALDVLFTLTVCDRFELAADAFAEAFQDARTRGSVLRFARCSAMRAMFHCRRGSLIEAESDARACIEVGAEAGYHLVELARSLLVDVLVERGETDEAENVLHAGGLLDAIADTFVLNYVLLSRATLRLAQRRVPEAMADLEELFSRETLWRAGNPAMMPIRSSIARALLLQDERDRARELASEELELAQTFGAPRAIGIALRTLGLTERGRHAIERLEEAVAVLGPSGARLEHARAQLELGAALRRAGKPSAAQQPLRIALDEAVAAGATVMAARARAELVAAGARPRRDRVRGVDALTPMERRVVSMAAEGMTNREIAQALFVTTRTVETHLTHAFQKLEISSRRELDSMLLAESGGSGHGQGGR